MQTNDISTNKKIVITASVFFSKCVTHTFYLAIFSK